MELSAVAIPQPSLSLSEFRLILLGSCGTTPLAYSDRVLIKRQLIINMDDAVGSYLFDINQSGADC